jgi:hypothetical protein
MAPLPPIWRLGCVKDVDKMNNRRARGGGGGGGLTTGSLWLLSICFTTIIYDEEENVRSLQ